VPLKRRTGTVVVVVVAVDPVFVEVVAVDPVFVEVVVADPVFVEVVVADPVFVDVVVADPEVVEVVVADPEVVDPVVVDTGRGTGKALAGVPSVDPGVPHAVRVIDIRAVNPRITTRCNLRGKKKNESTDTS